MTEKEMDLEEMFSLDYVNERKRNIQKPRLDILKCWLHRAEAIPD